MAAKHILKATEHEVVIKIYETASAGNTHDISLSTDLKLSSETFDASTANVTIQEIYWGAKKDKQIDINRITDPDANTIHGHYYLMNGGHYNFVGFVDDSYASKDIRVTGDGPFHVILKLRKSGGYTI